MLYQLSYLATYCKVRGYGNGAKVARQLSPGLVTRQTKKTGTVINSDSPQGLRLSAHCRAELRTAQIYFRYPTSGVFYCIHQAAGKQIRKSLKTADKKMACRRLEDRRRQFERCTTTDAQTLPFAEYDSNG